jgi:hypothetical protein
MFFGVFFGVHLTKRLKDHEFQIAAVPFFSRRGIEHPGLQHIPLSVMPSS